VLKDWTCNLFRKIFNLQKEVLIDASLEIVCLQNYPVPKNIELSGSDQKVFLLREDGQPAKLKGETGFSESNHELTPLALALKSFCLAPLWFLTEVCDYYQKLAFQHNTFL
jgi:hypothetical protein